MYVAIIVLFLVIVGALAFVLVSGQSKKKREMNVRFAESLGLEFQEKAAGGRPGFTGSHKGLPFKIWNEKDTDSEYSSVLHRAEMSAYQEIPSVLEIDIIRASGGGKLLDKTLGKIGGNRVEFDDPEFNERVIVKCKDPELAKRLLSQDVQQKLKEVEKGQFIVKKNSVRFDDSGMAQKNEGNLKAVIPVLALLAQKLGK
jgi:hypothetical protein